jgi:hypothetical protein
VALGEVWAVLEATKLKTSTKVAAKARKVFLIIFSP